MDAIRDTIRAVRGRSLAALLRSVLVRASRTMRFQLRTLPLRFGRPRVAGDASGGSALIVSLTTFPARARHVWATIETMLRQTHPPDAIVLALARSEFPDEHLPRSIDRLRRRGVIIVWVDRSARSYLKLIPARRMFPASTIVTVDDDRLYPADLIERLVAASEQDPRAVVGARGQRIGFEADGLSPSVTWRKLGRDPSGGEAPEYGAMLAGVGGILYRPEVPPSELLLDEATAVRLAPLADDVWFWACAAASGTPTLCICDDRSTANGRQGLSPALYDSNRSGNDPQITAVVEHLSLERHLEALRSRTDDHRP